MNANTIAWAKMMDGCYEATINGRAFVLLYNHSRSGPARAWYTVWERDGLGFIRHNDTPEMSRAMDDIKEGSHGGNPATLADAKAAAALLAGW